MIIRLATLVAYKRLSMVLVLSTCIRGLCNGAGPRRRQDWCHAGRNLSGDLVTSKFNGMRAAVEARTSDASARRAPHSVASTECGGSPTLPHGESAHRSLPASRVAKFPP